MVVLYYRQYRRRGACTIYNKSYQPHKENQMSNTKVQHNEVEVSSFKSMLYVEVKGKRIEIKEIDNPEDYGTDVRMYTKIAAKGATKGAKLYSVAIADYQPKRKKSQKDTILSLRAQGLTDSEIIAKLSGTA